MEALKRFFKALAGDEPGEDYPQILTYAYVFALSLIAIFTLLSHMIATHMSTLQVEREEILFQLRYQNTLIMDVSGYASSYYNEGMDYDQVGLTQSVEKLETSFEEIQTYVHASHGFQVGDALAILQGYYISDEFGMENKTLGYIKLARDFLAFGPTSTSEERKKILSEISQSESRRMVEVLNAAQEDFQRETITEIQTLLGWQRGISGAIFLIIILEALFIFRPLVGKLGRYHKTILTHSLQDSLTGLSNRRAFHLQSAEFFSKAQAEGKPFTVVLCDLDKFKTINDTYGHDVGDEVLKHFSRMMTTALRPQDFLARLGGEEFAFILTNTTPKTAAEILDNIQKKIRTTPCAYQSGGKKGNVSYTISCGYVVGHPSKILPVDTYLRYADIALYEAKEKGRDTHVRYLPPQKQEKDSGSGDSPE